MRGQTNLAKPWTPKRKTNSHNQSRRQNMQRSFIIVASWVLPGYGGGKTGGGRCNRSQVQAAPTPAPAACPCPSPLSDSNPTPPSNGPPAPPPLLSHLTRSLTCPAPPRPQHDAMLRTASDRWTILLGSREGKGTTLPVPC